METLEIVLFVIIFLWLLWISNDIQGINQINLKLDELEQGVEELEGEIEDLRDDLGLESDFLKDIPSIDQAGN